MHVQLLNKHYFEKKTYYVKRSQTVKTILVLCTYRYAVYVFNDPLLKIQSEFCAKCNS